MIKRGWDIPELNKLNKQLGKLSGDDDLTIFDCHMVFGMILHAMDSHPQRLCNFWYEIQDPIVSLKAYMASFRHTQLSCIDLCYPMSYPHDDPHRTKTIIFSLDWI